MRFYLRDHNFGDLVAQQYDQVIEKITNAGFDAKWSADGPNILFPGDVLVSHSGMGWRDDFDHAAVFGLQTINRRERLLVAQELGLAVVDWMSPVDLSEARLLFDRWRTSWIVYKANWSHARKGIFKWSRNKKLVLDTTYDPAADIFMKPTNGASETIKIDILFNKVVCSRVLPTPPIGSKQFYLPSRSSKLIPISSLFDEIAMKLGPHMVQYGSVYFSVDLMENDRELQIIEVNAWGVGRKMTWAVWPEYMVENYSQALLNWLSSTGHHPVFAKVRKNLEALRTNSTFQPSLQNGA